MAAGSIVIDLLMRTGSFETDTDRAGRALKKFERESRESARAISGAFSGLFAGLASALSVGAITQFVKATNDGIDKLNDLADATGSTVEKISALERVALTTGGSIDGVSSALVKFNQALTSAGDGGKAADVLRSIGLSADELKRLDPADALQRTAVALAQFADDGNKARAIQELFGKSVREVAPLLKDLAEAGQLNATVTKQQAEEAERFNKQLGFLKANAVDAARSLTGPLVTGLNELIERYKIGTQQGEGFLKFLARQTQIGSILGLSSRASTGGATGSFGDEDRPALQGRRPANEGGGGINADLINPRRARGVAQFAYAIGSAIEDTKRKFLELEKAGYESGQRALEQLLAASEEGLSAIRDPIEEQRQAFLRSEKAAYDVGDAIKEVSTFAKDFGLTFSSALEDAIVQSRRFSDVLKGLAQDILRILVRKSITEPLGAAITAAFPARASGGPVSGGSTYLVGERGPELFTPNTTGRIIPNNALGGAAPQVRVTVNAPPGTQVERQESRNGPTGPEVELWLANRIASGASPVNAALKARGVNLNGALPRRA